VFVAAVSAEFTRESVPENICAAERAALPLKFVLPVPDDDLVYVRTSFEVESLPNPKFPAEISVIHFWY
jgi:hypothetical protein